jgi:hypothetical protein
MLRRLGDPKINLGYRAWMSQRLAAWRWLSQGESTIASGWSIVLQWGLPSHFTSTPLISMWVNEAEHLGVQVLRMISRQTPKLLPFWVPVTPYRYAEQEN